MKKRIKIITFLLLSTIGLFAQEKENILFSFQTERGKTLKISVRKQDNAVIYRLYNQGKIELQFPKNPSFKENKNFNFTYLIRNGGTINEAASLARLEFFIDQYRYSVYQSSFLEDDYKAGITVLNLKLQKSTEIPAKESTIKGNLMDFKENEYVPITEL